MGYNEVRFDEDRPYIEYHDCLLELEYGEDEWVVIDLTIVYNSELDYVMEIISDIDDPYNKTARGSQMKYLLKFLDLDLVDFDHRPNGMYIELK